PGIITMTPKQAAWQRRSVLLTTLLPFAGLIAAVSMLWGTGLSVTDAAIALSFYVFTGLGITIGYHRYFTHQGFKTSRPVRALLAIAGSMAMQGSVLSWVADHRRHHAFSDKEGDPHSPHLDEGPGIKGILKGLWHAHMGWLFEDKASSPERWCPDLARDPMMVRISNLYPLWLVMSLTLPALLGYLFTGTLMGAVTAGLWGSLVRIFMLHHVTWSINSICHFYGERPFRSDDHSTNNWPLALISFGESWHNNHHAFPTSAVHGIKRSQIDISGMLITLAEKLRVVSDVKRVTEKQLRVKSS
ncbi:MAG: acyl-CoA desaturase, partial [Actinomycetota bacterium]